MPIVFSTTLNNINWSIGLEVTLSVLGFTDINTPTIGVMIYWANQHTAMVAGIWWWIFFPVALVVITFIGLFLLVVLPLGQMMLIALSERMGGGLSRFSLTSFGAFFGEPLYWNALMRTAFFAIAVTFITLVIDESLDRVAVGASDLHARIDRYAGLGRTLLDGL